MRLPERIDQSDLYIDQPFELFEIEDFLDPAFIAELEATFPTKDDATFVRYEAEYGAKEYLNDRHAAFAPALRARPAWQRLYDMFCDPMTLDRLAALRGAKWKFAPGTSRPARLLGRIAAFGRDHTAVRLGFEFSVMEPGTSITPHCDAPNKLLSLMLYFPEDEGQYELGTEFYGAATPEKTRDGWASGLMVMADIDAFFADHRLLYKSRFTPNKLVGFVKSGISWHGLPPINSPLPRRSLNVNIYTA